MKFGRAAANPHLGALHILTFSAFPSITLYIHNAKEAVLADGLISLGLGLAFGLAAYFVVSLACGRTPLSTAWALIGITAFLNYGHFRGLCRIIGESFFQYQHIRHRHTLLLTMVLSLFLAAVAYWLSRKSGTLKILLKIASQTLAAVMLINIVFLLFGVGVRRTLLTRPPVIDNQAVSAVTPTTQRPDIYYLIFDRYAHAEELKKHLNFDNSNFLRFLERKGFVLPPVAFANYSGSLLSIASSLNMQHLQFIPEQIGVKTNRETPVYALFQNHEIGRFLRKIGYTYYHIGNVYTPSSFNQYADTNINDCIWGNDTYLHHFFSTTLLDPFLQALSPSPAVNQVKSFDRIAELADRAEPKFIFAHFLLPHIPYVFEADGTLLPPSRYSNDDPERYRAQLQFTNRKIRELVTAIEARSKRPFLMVLQSDEGPYPCDIGKSDIPGGRELHGRILNALRLPGVSTGDIQKLKSPVNTFRLIFNHYFNAGLEFEPDRAYLSQPNALYDFIDITNEILEP